MKVEMKDENLIRPDGFKGGSKITVKWLGNSKYDRALLCLKSAYQSYDEFVQLLINIELQDTVVINNDLYLQKVNVAKKSAEYSRDILKPPYDVIILPLIDDNYVLLPSQEKFNAFLQTMKLDIFYHRYIENTGFLGLGKEVLNRIDIRCESDRIQFDDAIVYYNVNGIDYPITKYMFNEELEITVLKKMEVKLSINHKYSRYYNLREDR